MRNRRILPIIATVLLTLVYSVYAHPGRLDENGGHNDYINGGYHYHSGDSQGYSRYTVGTAPQQKSGDNTILGILISPFCILLIWCIIEPIIETVNELIKNIKQKKQAKEKRINMSIFSWFKKSKSTPPPRKFVRVSLPSNIALNERNLPYCTNKVYGYGKRFNAFVTHGGKYYHRSNCNYLKNKKKTVIHRYDALKSYQPCKHCKPISYIDDWYIDFLKTNFPASAEEYIQYSKTKKDAEKNKQLSFDDMGRFV